MSNTFKPIKIRLLKEAEKYILSQNLKIQKKFFFAFDKTERGFKGNWFEKLKGSDGIFEFRLRDHEKYYRLFAFWDKDKSETLIIGTHGIDKKSNKTPKKEVRKAEHIKRNYFETKNKIK